MQVNDQRNERLSLCEFFLCTTQRHLGDGGAFEISRGYVVMLYELSTTGSILT